MVSTKPITPAIEAFDEYPFEDKVVVYSLVLEDNGAPSKGKTVSHSAPTFANLAQQAGAHHVSNNSPVPSPTASHKTLCSSNQPRCRLSSSEGGGSVHELPTRWLTFCSLTLPQDPVRISTSELCIHLCQRLTRCSPSLPLSVVYLKTSLNHSTSIFRYVGS